MKHVLVGIGEILWDNLPSGKQLGGAPANFAYYASNLGEEGIIVSRVGNDELGLEILNRLQDLKLASNFITLDDSHPTGIVSVKVDREGVPDFTIQEEVAWDYLPEVADLANLAQRADAICFGTLAQRSPTSCTTIRNFLQNTSEIAFRILDINLRQAFYSEEIIEKSLDIANVLKLNVGELRTLREIFALKGDEHSLLVSLSENFSLKMVALTKGSRGSVLYADDRISIHHGYSASLDDTVGAGDAFSAAMAIGMLGGYELDKINDLANRLASYVCTQSGATPTIPRKIQDLF